MKKSAWNESQLRRLIRKIVQEELSQNESNQKTSPPTSSQKSPNDRFDGFSGFDGFDGFDEFGPSFNERPAPSTPQKKTQPAPAQPNVETTDEPWAIFGAPEPAPTKTRRVKEERPRALPGWSEPYRPNYSELESSLTSSRKKKR